MTFWRRVHRKKWLLYLTGVTALGIVYHAGPSVFNAGPVMNIIGASAVVAIFVGVRLHRPDRRLPWYLIAAAQALFVAGDVVAYNYEKLFHTELPYPSVADALYLAVYPCLVAGLLILIRQRSPGGDRPGLIDSLTVSIGIGVLSWQFLMAPYAKDASLPLLTRLISMAYPVMDVLILTVLVRLAVGAGKRGRSFWLLIAAFASLLGTDASFGYRLLHGGYEPGALLDAGWMAFYALLGAAALHPSMPSLSDPIHDQESRLTRVRLGLLAVAATLAPVTGVLLVLFGGDASSLPLPLSSVALFLLVVWRMAGLVRRNAESALRERALREAGTDLVISTNRAEIHAAMLKAAEEIAGSRRLVSLVTPADDLRDVSEPARSLLLRGDVAEVSPGQDGSGEWSFVVPLSTQGSGDGLLMVRSEDRCPPSIKDGLTALGAQVSMALESAALTEALVRQQSEARFASLVQHSSDVLAVVDTDTAIRYISPSVHRVLGYNADELENTQFADLVIERDIFLAIVEQSTGRGSGSIECRLRRPDGTWAYVEALCTNLLHDETVSGIVLNVRDISDRKAFEEQLEKQAFSDATTGLANRALLRDRIEHAMDRDGRTGRALAVLFIDLDDFKTVNDSLGHAAGDDLLWQVGRVLRSCLRTSDTAARLGGDEFAVLLESPGDLVDVVEVAGRVLTALEQPFTLDGKEVFITASIGIAVSDVDRHDGVDDLLRDADVAMYAAKKQGKGRYQVFAPEMHDAVIHRLELKADLQRAVENREFELEYQPIFEFESMTLHGFEALIRWRHPERGLVQPGEFIPLAEETGLIVPIGSWVIEQACADSQWIAAQFPQLQPLVISVNVSPGQFQRPELVNVVRDALRASGCSPANLVIEITESAMMQDVDKASARLQELRAVGVRIAVDDFGTGYSSLNYIRRFPIDTLKIDKSFVQGISENAEVASMTQAIIDLASALSLQPIAEGIESADQVASLRRLGCTLGQGFYFSRPLGRKNLERFLRVQAATVDRAAGVPVGQPAV